MVRNESTITMENTVRRVLIVYTLNRDTVRLGDHALQVAGTGPLFRPLAPQPLEGLIRTAGNIVLRSTQPLRYVIAPWIRKRCISSNVCWEGIDEIAAWLSMRFIPQVEVVRTEAGVHTSQRLPRAYINVGLGTGNIPMPEADQDHEMYYCDDATTFSDNVFCTRGEAVMSPVLRTGTWCNVVELITGLGIGTYTHHSTGTEGNVFGTGQALDDISRVLHKRRAFEEFKKLSGLADEVVSIVLMGESRHFWDIIVEGEGHDADSAAAMMEYLIAGVPRDLLSWEVNKRNEEVVPTNTELRTPLALNLNDAMDRGRYELPPSDGMTLITGTGGDWQQSRYGQTHSVPSDSVSCERALQRLNLLQLADEELLYAVRPQNTPGHGLSFRVDSCLFTIQGAALGWRGGEG